MARSNTPFNSTALHEDDKYFHLDVSHISLTLLVLGAYFTTINQASYFLKERLFLSSALISICLGIGFGPIGANVLSPWAWTGYDEEARHELTFQLTRIVIGIQVMFAGIDLPAAYLRKQAWSMFMLLIPIMTVAWFICGGFIHLLIPSLTFLESLCISACITPTDPILANAIVKGRFAEKYVPKAVRDLISAESGANDGLGYPFIFITFFLMERQINDWNYGLVVGHWVVSTWLYQIALACAIGAVIGYAARKTVKVAHRKQLIDHESFSAFGVGCSFLVLGVVGVLGSDDILACFVAGNALTWCDYVRVETEDYGFQDVIDSLLNASIFLYLGALIPWSELSMNGLVPWKLVLLAIAVLCLRRLPWVLSVWKLIPAIPDTRQAIFTGWFGPIGVSAVYYAELAYKELPEERERLRAVIGPVVLFIAFSSTVVHGCTVPILKLAPKAFERTKSTFSIASSSVRRPTAALIDKTQIIHRPMTTALNGNGNGGFNHDDSSRPSTPLATSRANSRPSSRSQSRSRLNLKGLKGSGGLKDSPMGTPLNQPGTPVNEVNHHNHSSLDSDKSFSARDDMVEIDKCGLAPGSLIASRQDLQELSGILRATTTAADVGASVDQDGEMVTNGGATGGDDKRKNVEFEV
ncbi:hypothetical protein OIO90_000240 [Microbotryomycetes sp. JL221]|nr:hypothetical protein OIO90_000240 [Microbotryomycetes sp. JL221]